MAYMEIGIGVDVNGKKNLFGVHKTSESAKNEIIQLRGGPYPSPPPDPSPTM